MATGTRDTGMNTAPGTKAPVLCFTAQFSPQLGVIEEIDLVLERPDWESSCYGKGGVGVWTRTAEFFCW
jgi:hypothetical protein